jgi:hypothetical protein
MVNEEKVRLMTHIAIYEKKEENKDMVLGKFYREDYIKYNCLKTLVASTLCYWMFVAVFLMMKFQDILNQIDDMDYFKAIYLLMAGYVGFALLYQIFAFVLYAIRFQRAKVGLVNYNRNLKKLIVFGEARPKKRKKTQAIRVNNSIGGEEIEFENPKGRRNN